jgi:aryl-alcohol dehydrogenase-like predicted oxidoreductase
MTALLSGSAHGDGTASYADRMGERTARGHFRRFGTLSLSSIGLGTYLGSADDDTDTAYQDAVMRAVELGINVIDTASNYRHQRSERAVGRALARAVEAAVVRREEVVVASKAGFIAFDGDRPADPRAHVQRALVDAGLLEWTDVVAGCHTLAPLYLGHAIEQSRRNLGLESIDIYYLHNPETQLDEVARDVFADRIRRAFEALEQACHSGAIGCYGAATWAGFRVPPGHPGHLSMAELVGLAREVGGADHRFRVVQLPYNLSMPEARVMATQRIGGAQMPALDAAARLGLYVMSSGSIAQGKLAARLPRAHDAGDQRLRTPAQRALQFARSAPGMGTALVGMKNPAHVEENAELARIPPITT